jgi:O-succinylbenzoic acid--CoA ligase
MLDWLAQQAEVSPEKIALIEGEQSWSYWELNRLVADMAGRLIAAGVRAGDHVAVLMPNRLEYVCLIHALTRLGATLVPLNIRLTPPELHWQIEQADCAWVICSQETETQVAGLVQTRLHPNDDPGGEALAGHLTHLPQNSTPLLFDQRQAPKISPRLLSVDPSQGTFTEALADFPAEDAANWQSRPLSLERVQGIVYTSGTTGYPKGAMLTYANHFWSATASAFRLGVDPADCWLVCMPLYHVGGMAIILRSCLYGTTVVLQRGFDPLAVSQALKRQKITLISVVPTMLHRLLEMEPGALTASSLRCILIGGAAATPALVERCLALKLPIAASYGLTEAASQVATALANQVGRKPGNVGKPLLFSSIRVVDEQGSSLPPGKIGEIVVRGPSIMEGYYNQIEATEKVLRNGELYTGDMGYLDEEGDLWVVQRRADLIVSGGENIYPAEVEQVLEQYPGVKEVCVVGLEDEEWGQVVAAAVVIAEEANLIAEELIRFGRERLAGYKQPRRVYFVEALPRTASGKIRREGVKALIKTLMRSKF